MFFHIGVVTYDKAIRIHYNLDNNLKTIEFSKLSLDFAFQMRNGQCI